ncbi:hypothetical protein DESPIGER_2269 [Desulfovibrio piger]|uniref:Uncharacterized protein n=1 Tax=Desulfovibrio piger TaxID=901 RepID=A0A1K1LHC3_9BACT|nr:hypothetical protein DESPIGER_2269 [Desulfovibrio piger]
MAVIRLPGPQPRGAEDGLSRSHAGRARPCLFSWPWPDRRERRALPRERGPGYGAGRRR